MKSVNLSKNILYVFYLLPIAFVISMGGFYPTSIAMGFLYAGLLSYPTAICGVFVFLVLLKEIKTLSFLGIALITLAYSLSAYLIKFIKGKWKEYLQAIFSFLPFIIYCVFSSFGVLDSVISCILCALTYYFAMHLVNSEISEFSTVDLACVFVIILFFMMGVNKISIDYFPVYPIFESFFTLLIFEFLGYSKGVFLSLAFPFANYITTGEVGCLVSLLVVFALFFLLNGRAKRVIPLILIAQRVFLTYFIPVYLDDSIINVLLYSIGCLGYYLLPKSEKIKKVEIPERIINQSLKDSSLRLKEIAKSLKWLASDFKEKEGEEVNLPTLITDTLVDGCKECKYFPDCKAQNGVKESFELLAISATAKGNVNMLDADDNIYKNCKYIDKVLYTVNDVIKSWKKYQEKQMQTSKYKESISVVFEGLSNVLNYEAGELNKEIAFDKELELALYEELKLQGVKAKEIFCIKNSQGYPIVKIDFEGANLKGKQIAKTVSKVCGMPMIAKKDTKSKITSFLPKITCDVLFGCATKKKDGSSLSGDCFSLTRISDYSYMLAISDGMGSGIEARETSEQTLNFVENLFKVGFSYEVVCPLVNTILSFSGKDRYSATDIVIIDLIRYFAIFLKLGSPPCYLVREKIVEIEGSSLPVGILEKIEPTKKQLAVKSGDLIIVMSDGVYDLLGSSTPFVISHSPTSNPQEICDYLMMKAEEKLEGEKRKDDMTVIALKII